MLKKYTFILLFTLVSNGLFSQIGSWTEHLSYNKVKAITVANNRIYAISESGVFYYDTKDNAIVKLSKVTGISDIEPSTIKYDTKNNTLLIGYKNGNIDLLKGESVINISDIKQKNILGDKSINEVYYKGNFAYLSTGFGIVVLDVLKQEIKETYFIGDNESTIRVNEVALTDSIIYAATTLGLRYCRISQTNPLDFNNWKFVDGIPKGKEYSSVACLNNTVYASISVDYGKDTLYYLKNNKWQYLYAPHETKISDINITNNKICISAWFLSHILDSNHVEVSKVYTYGNKNKPEYIYETIVTLNDDVWMADEFYGLVNATNINNSKFYIPEGPYSSDAFSLEISGNTLFVAAGGINGAYNNLLSRNGIYKLTSKWESYNYSTIKNLKYENYYDFIDLTIAPTNENRFFATSWGAGIFEFNDTSFVNYNENNSTLEPYIENGNKDLKIGGTALDKKGNLWYTNARASKAIGVRSKQGIWYSYKIDELNNIETIGDIIVDKNNYKWLLLGKSIKAIYVYDDNSTLDNYSDDQYIKLQTAGGEKINCIVEDKKGNMWVGTDKGIYVNYDTKNVFKNALNLGERIVVSDASYNEYLLENEIVLDIAIDGADRKWITTANAGVFLVSANGKEQLLHFNKQNSPLFSDYVLSVAINSNSGEVYFATDKGIVSYTGTATEAKTEFSDVIAYPNPVPSNYSGSIGIKGLVKGSIVKITDMYGSLVFETTSEGGQAVWDGRKFDGEKVTTGVYLVFMSDVEGEKTLVTKILFIK